MEIYSGKSDQNGIWRSWHDNLESYENKRHFPLLVMPFIALQGDFHQVSNAQIFGSLNRQKRSEMDIKISAT